jgi:thioredoxin-related protein
MILIFFLSFTILPASFAIDVKINWLTDFNSAQDQAKDNKRMMVVAFYTSWCLYCKKYDRDVFTDSRIIDLSKEFVFAKLDAEIQKAATIRYRPEGYPTIIFSSPSGKEILRIAGYRDADQFLAVLEAVRDHGDEISKFLAIVDKNPKDCVAHESLGKLYLQIGLFDKAQHHLNKALKALPASACITDEKTESDEERILFVLSQTYLADKNFRKASKTLEKLVDKNPTCDCIRTYWLELGRVYTEWGKGKKANKVLEKLVDMYPDSKEAKVATDLIYQNLS